MRITKIIPGPVREMLKEAWRYHAIRRALRPLQLRGMMTAGEVEAFHDAWGNTGFSADPAYLTKLLGLLTAGPVLECGTGGTTLLESVLGVRHGFKVCCLEQDPEWAVPVMEWRLDAVRVATAPLKDYGACLWYDPPEDLPSHFALIVCDGPFIDKSLGEPYYSAWRYGVLSWLKSTGRTFDILLLDDVNDPRAPAILGRWQEEFGVKVDRIKSADGELALIRPFS